MEEIKESIGKKRGRKKGTFGFESKDFSELEKDAYIKKWLKLNDDKDDCRKRLGVFQKYVDFTGKTPTQLIKEHHKDRQKEPLEQEEIAKKNIKDFFRYLRDEITDIDGKKYTERYNKKKGMSHNSARQYSYSKIASFYKRCGVGVEFLKGEIPREHKNVKSQVIRENGDRVSLDDEKVLLKKIREALPYLRTKTIFQCKISSGLLDSDIFSLKMKDYEDGLYPDFRVCYIEGNRQKSDIRFQSFFNSEAIDFLDLYIKQRKAKAKERKARGLDYEEITNDSWLFADLDGNGNQIYPDQFRKQLRKTCEMLGIKNLTPKRLRKYFNHIGIKQLHADKEIIERMMGHVGTVSAKYQPYFDYPDDLAKLYSNQLDGELCLGNGNQVKTKISVLKKKVEDMEDQVKSLRIAKEKYEANNIVLSKELIDFRKEVMGIFQEIISANGNTENIDLGKIWELGKGRKLKENIKPKEFGIFTEKETISKKNLRKK